MGVAETRGVTRRHFLGLVAASVVVAGCDRSVAPTSGVSTLAPTTIGPGTTLALDTGDLPFSVWEQMITALRTSPDHLPAAADAVVDTGDPAAIFAFVRDRIAVLPPRPSSFGSADTRRLWGTRGVLRCGAGTPRERADLLAELYARAGFEAEVRVGAYPPGFDVAPILGRRQVGGFAPDLDPASVERWNTALGIERSKGPTDPDLDGASSAALAGMLSSLLPTGTAAPEVLTVPEPFNVPVVVVKVDGEERTADTLATDAVLGQSPVGPLVPAGPAAPFDTVTVRLEAARSTDPGATFTLVEGTWPVDRLVGRLLVVRTVPTGDLASQLALPMSQIHAFTALAGIDGIDLTPDEMAAAAVTGDPVTVFGDQIVADESGTPTIAGTPVGVADPTSASAVSSLSGSVSGSAFPTVAITGGAFGSDGRPVLDLPASAFRLEEGGTPVPFLLEESRPPTPRALILFDTSRSIPPEFLDREASSFAADLAGGILQTHPDAAFRLGGVNYGLASLSPTWLTTAEEVGAEADRVIGDGSELWSALADARGSGANLIVLVTDAHATDAPEAVAAARSWVHSGPPVLVVGVGDYDTAIAEDIAQTSGGTVLGVADRAAALTAVEQAIAGRTDHAYRLRYTAPMDGPSTRQVSLTVGSASLELSYDVPSPAERLLPVGLSGLYLTVETAGRTVTRTLAGMPWERRSRSEPVTAEMLSEVRFALFGSAVLSLEPETPTLAVWLDDFLTAKLTLRALRDLPAGDLAAEVDALASGVHAIPPELLVLQAALPDGTAAGGFPRGPRMVLLTDRSRTGAEIVHTGDLLPFDHWASAGDSRQAFTETMTRTARLAIAEQSVYQDCTLSRLEGRPLAYLAPSVPASRQGPYAGLAKMIDGYSDRHRLLPTDDGPFAMWAIAQDGSILGVLPDGSGGGSNTSQIVAQCKAVDQIATYLGLAGSPFGFTLAAFIALQKAIARQALREALVIATLGGEVPSGCQGAISNLGCDLAKAGLSSLLPGFGKLNNADSIWSAMGGPSFVKCFNSQ